MTLSFTISGRELRSYFNSPVAYVFLVVFLMVASGLFMTPFFLAGLCDMRAFFSNLPLLLVVFVPALTMRSWAEEARSGTLSLLFSLPIGSGGLVIGKFIASLIFCTLAILSTFTIPVMLHFLGRPDYGPIAGGYLGSILLASFLLALGMSISAFFKDQIVAFILALVAGFFCFLAGTEFFSTFIDSWVPGLGTFLRHGIGIQSHFASFAKGVIDITDVLFFLSFTAIFLLINILTVEGLLKFRIKKGFYPAVILLFGIGIFLNAILFDIRLPRFDLTENRIYTISPGTKRVLEKLKVPISVVYYCSSKEKMPTAMKELSRDVGDILDELAKLSPKFTYRIVDPDELTEKEREQLRKKGILPFNTQTIEKDALNIKRVYSAIQLSYLDKKDEIIPQVLPDSLGSLEYDIVSKIFRLTLDKKPKVVLIAPKIQIPLQTALMYQRLGQPVPPAIDHFRTLEELLRSQGYQVVRQELKKDSPLPEDADCLLVIGPQEFNKRQKYEIRRYLSSGKPLLLAFQQYQYRYTNSGDGMVATVERLTNNLNDLIKDTGVSVSDKMLFDKRSAVLSVETSTQMGLFTALVRTPVKFPMQIEVLPDSMNQDVSITSNLTGLLYLWGSSLKVDDDTILNNSLDLTTLFSTSPKSWVRPYHPGYLTKEDLTPDSSAFKKRPLAILLTGVFQNPFGKGEIPKWPGEEANSTETKKASKDDSQRPGESTKSVKSKLILIGSSEMFTDRTLSALSNASLMLNCVDVFCLGDELIHIRTKNQVQRLIKDVESNERLFWKAFTIFLMPFVWAAFGIFRAMKRKKARLHCSFSWQA